MQLSARDAARFLGVSESTLYRWVRRGELPAHRVNDQYVFNRVALLEFAAERRIDVATEMLELADAGPPPPSLADAVRAGGIHYGVRGADKPAILRAVVDLLRLPPKLDRDLLYNVLLAREALGSTGFGGGVAIPHPRNPIVLHVAEPMVAICFLAQPVDFQALDGQPVHTLCALVSPSVRAHLHLLAVLAAALRDPEIKPKLEARAPASEILAGIERVESALAARRAGAPA